MANKRKAITGGIKLTKWDGVVLSGSVYTTALTMPSAVKDAPETAVATGLLGIDTQGRGRLDVTFGGSDAANETINYQVIGYRHSEANGANGYVPEKIAAGAATLGTQTFGTEGAYVEASTSLWADTITETLATGFALVSSPADNTMARLSIDVSPFIYATVQVERGTAATANVVANLADWIGGLASFDADVTLGNVGLLDSSGTAIDASAAYAEDTAHASGDWVTPGGAVRTDTRASLAGTTGDYAPPQLTANGDMRTKDDDLYAAVSPGTSNDLTAVATSDAEWTSITLTAGALYAEVSLTGGNAYYVCKTATPADADTGAIMYANILCRINTRGRTKIWIRRTAGTDVTIHVTDYL